MPELTIHELDAQLAEQLPTRELMGRCGCRNGGGGEGDGHEGGGGGGGGNYSHNVNIGVGNGNGGSYNGILNGNEVTIL